MENSLDLAVVWALCGAYMCYQFWPMPGGGQENCSDPQELAAVKWPKRAHPGAPTKAGQERTPWLTSWARATFEQGCLSVLPHLEGLCKAISLPGEHLFQASRIAPNRMRPIIFYAFGKAKLDAPAQLARLARQGWETLPIAILGMPYNPAAWSLEAWRPIGGCCFAGVPSALTGNSAFRFCLLMQWHAIPVSATALFQDARKEEDTDLESAHTVSETDQDFLERSLMAAAADQNSRESGSSLPERLLAGEKACSTTSCRPSNPQLMTPPLFVPWHEIAKQFDIPVEHEAQAEDLRAMFQTAIGILPTEHQHDFYRLHGIAFSQISQGRVPVEMAAPIVLAPMYETHPWAPYWESTLWHMAQSYRFWLAVPESPPPGRIQINCGGLGGGTLDSPTTPAFHCTHPRVNGTCV